MGATWHARPRGKATRARAAPTWRIVHIYLFILYIIRGIQPPVYQQGIQPIRSSGLINPTISFLLFRVGLIHTAFIMQVTWHDEERRIKWTIDRHASIEWTRGPRIKIKTTCFLKRIITVRLSATWRHHTRRSSGRVVHRRSSSKCLN